MLTVYGTIWLVSLVAAFIVMLVAGFWGVSVGDVKLLNTDSYVRIIDADFRYDRLVLRVRCLGDTVEFVKAFQGDELETQRFRELNVYPKRVEREPEGVALNVSCGYWEVVEVVVPVKTVGAGYDAVVRDGKYYAVVKKTNRQELVPVDELGELVPVNGSYEWSPFFYAKIRPYGSLREVWLKCYDGRGERSFEAMMEERVLRMVRGMFNENPDALDEIAGAVKEFASKLKTTLHELVRNGTCEPRWSLKRKIPSRFNIRAIIKVSARRHIANITEGGVLVGKLYEVFRVEARVGPRTEPAAAATRGYRVVVYEPSPPYLVLKYVVTDGNTISTRYLVLEMRGSPLG